MTEVTTTKRQMSFSVLDDGRIEASFGDNVPSLFLNPAEVPEATQLLAISEGLISRTRGYVSRLEGDDRTPENMAAAVAKGFANEYRIAFLIKHDGWPVPMP